MFPIFLPECNHISILSAGFNDSTISNVTQTRAVGAQLTKADHGRTDRHEDANRLFSPVHKRAKNSKYWGIPVKIQRSYPMNKGPEVQSVSLHQEGWYPLRDRQNSSRANEVPWNSHCTSRKSTNLVIGEQTCKIRRKKNAPFGKI